MWLEHHNLDPYPMPKGKNVLFVNERKLADKYTCMREREEEPGEDNIRIYVPLDLNKKEILHRLDMIICHYGEANESNEFAFELDVQTLIWQIEIYDQVWYGRHAKEGQKHSAEATELVKEFVAKLEEIPDGCAESFPFEMIDGLRDEFLGEM